MINTTGSIKRIQAISHQMEQFLRQSGLPACFFGHDMTFSNGRGALLYSNAEYPVFYHNNRPLFVCTDKTGRTLTEGTYLSRSLQEVEEYGKILSSTQKLCGYQHFFFITVNESDRQNLYAFHFNCSETDFLHHIINNQYRYEQFIHHYRSAFADLIDNECEKHQSEFPMSNIQLSNDVSFSLFDDANANKLIMPSNVDNTIVNLLSPQQTKCLSLLIKGMTSREIAAEMQLSHRTIEHYILAMRVKLKCKNIKELIARYS